MIDFSVCDLMAVKVLSASNVRFAYSQYVHMYFKNSKQHPFYAYILCIYHELFLVSSYNSEFTRCKVVKTQWQHITMTWFKSCDIGEFCGCRGNQGLCRSKRALCLHLQGFCLQSPPTHGVMRDIQRHRDMSQADTCTHKHTHTWNDNLNQERRDLDHIRASVCWCVGQGGAVWQGGEERKKRGKAELEWERAE